MIIATTDYDAVTVVLHSHAQRLFNDTSQNDPAVTFLPKATAAAIEQELLSRPNEPFLFFGHGAQSPDWGFITQDGQPAGNHGMEPLFAGRKVAASCCHCDRTGPQLQRHGTQMMGYNGDLWVPDAAFGLIMEEAVLAGPKVVAAGGSVTDAATAAQKGFRALARSLRDANGPAWGLHLFMSLNAEAVGTW